MTVISMFNIYVWKWFLCEKREPHSQAMWSIFEKNNYWAVTLNISRHIFTITEIMKKKKEEKNSNPDTHLWLLLLNGVSFIISMYTTEHCYHLSAKWNTKLIFQKQPILAKNSKATVYLRPSYLKEWLGVVWTVTGTLQRCDTSSHNILWNLKI